MSLSHALRRAFCRLVGQHSWGRWERCLRSNLITSRPPLEVAEINMLHWKAQAERDHDARVAAEREVHDLEVALAETQKLGPARGGNQGAQEVEVVLYYIRRRDGEPVRDRLTPRMEARRIIDALDAHRRSR